MADMKKHVIKMAALGRQFQLGGLYDYTNDQTLKSSPGWKPIDLSESVEVQSEFKMKIIPAEADSNNWEQMRLDEHLKASTLAGLIEKYRGASNYLNDHNSPGQVSHTVVFQIKTKKENLDLSTFTNQEVGNIEEEQTNSTNSEIPFEVVPSAKREVKTVETKKGKSTVKSEVNAHVIVGIVYGAEIYCVLTQDLADETDEDAREEAKSNLSDWAGQMESALEDNQDLNEFKGQFEKEEKQQLTRMKCRLYVDIQTPNFKECGFFDAYKHCLKLVEQVKKLDGKSKVVPIAYKLCPLKIINDPVAAAKNPIENREVDADLIARCCNIWTQLGNIIARATALKNSAKNVNRTPLSNFISFVEKYQELMRKRMKIGVLQSRNSSDDDDADQEFENIVNIVEKHLNFKPSRLEKWLRYKSAEIEMIKEISKLKEINFVSTTEQLTNQLTQSFDKTFALVLQVVGLDERTNEILVKMEHVKFDTKLMAVNNDDEDEDGDDDEDTDAKLPWHMIPSKKKQVLDKMREFSNHVAKNQEAENQVQFFVTLSDKKKGFGCIYSVYENDQLLKENVQLPGPPTDLQVNFEKTSENARNTKICLKWKYKDVGYPHHFLVEYRQSGSLDPWTQQNATKQGQKQVTINCKRGLMLEFRVAAETCIGRSNFSKIIDMDSASIDDYNDDDDDEESVYSSASQSTLKSSIQSKIRMESDKTFKKPMKKDDFDYSDGESDVSSVSKSTRTRNEPKMDRRQKIQTNELFSSMSTLPKTKGTYSHTSVNTSSHVNSSRDFDTSTLADQSNFASTISQNWKKIGTRNGMDLFAVPLKKSNVGSAKNVVQRFVFGETDQKKGQHKTILVMGATGSGKTTLINGMINYIFGVEWEDTFRFQLINEQLGRSQAHSQTSIITAYDIHHMEGFRIPYSLTIVDTPGYGDTKGLERDQEITDMIRKFFEDKNGIQELDVVGFVAQASLPRLTPTQIYIFDSVLAIFGKDVKENINFLLTFADSQVPPVLSAITAAGLPCPTDPDGNPLHHKFNNSGFFCSSHESDLVGAADKFNRFFWRMGMENFDNFFSVLATMKTKSLSLTKKVLDERKKLEATVDGLQPLIKIGLAKMEEMRKTKQMITNSQAQIDANEDVKIEVEVTVPKKVEIPRGQHLTNCNKCYMTCHNPCGIPNDDDKKGCWAMDSQGNCRICPEKCIWNMHANQPYCWEYVKEKQTTSSDAIKEKYESELKRKLTSQDLIKLLQRDLEENDKEVLGRVNIVAECIKRLDEIALRPNPFSTPQYIDLIIDAEEQEKKPGFKERIQSLKKLRQMAVITSKVRNNESLFERRDDDFDSQQVDEDDDNDQNGTDDDDDSYDGASLVSAATNNKQFNPFF